jgi:hypothetical protein
MRVEGRALATHWRNPCVRLRLSTLGWNVRHPLVPLAWIGAAGGSSGGNSRATPPEERGGTPVSGQSTPARVGRAA